MGPAYIRQHFAQTNGERTTNRAIIIQFYFISSMCCFHTNLDFINSVYTSTLFGCSDMRQS